MGAPIEETTIINRCRKEQSYEYRRDHGMLPEDVAEHTEASVATPEDSGPSMLPTTMGQLSHPGEVAKVVDVVMRHPVSRLHELLPDVGKAAREKQA